MHTFKGKHGTTIFHHGDFDGEVKVFDKFGKHVEIEMEELLDFVAESIRDKMIGRIERASTEELLRGEFK